MVYFNCILNNRARRSGAEVTGWTLDRKIRVRFPAYPHRVWALWWQGGKRRLQTSRCPCRGRLGTLKTPSCPWRGCPAAGQNLETGHLSRHYIAEIPLNVTLNHNQHQQHLNNRRTGKDATKHRALGLLGHSDNAMSLLGTFLEIEQLTNFVDRGFPIATVTSLKNELPLTWMITDIRHSGVLYNFHCPCRI